MLASKAALRNAKKSHTREVLDVVDWGTGRIESTPHGFFEKMMTKNTTSGPPKAVSGTFKSSVKFDDYNPVRGKVDSEFPKGKRMNPVLP